MKAGGRQLWQGGAGAGADRATGTSAVGASWQAPTAEEFVEEVRHMLQVQMLGSDSSTAVAGALGESMLRKPPVSIDHVLGELASVTVDMEDVAKALQGLRSKFKAASRRDDKKLVQALFNDMVHILCQRAGNGLHACDTSRSGYPMNPHHRIALILSTAPKPETGQVLWPDVVAPMELKPNISCSEAHTVALGQLRQRADALFHVQPDRRDVFGIAADGLAVEVVHFWRNQWDNVCWERTDLHFLDLSAESPGLHMLACLAAATPSQLGHSRRLGFGSFTARVGDADWSITQRETLQERRTAVYSCSCSGASEFEAVLKLGDTSLDEVDILRHLNEQGVGGIPQLWHEGKLNGDPYLIITPKGIDIAPDWAAQRLISVVMDVAQTLRQLSTAKVLHLDIAPNNILLSPEGRGLLVDFHVSQRGASEVHDSGCGRLAFKSLTRLQCGMATLSGELESLLYTLLFWACDGHLPWRRAVNRSAAFDSKFTAMTINFQNKVMSRCTWGRADQEVLQRLRRLFFGNEDEGWRYEQHVDEGAFIAACTG